MPNIPACPNLARTLFALVAEGEGVSMQVVGTATVWAAYIESYDGSSYGPVFSADDDMVALIGQGTTGREAILALEVVCSRPEHLAALTVFDL